MNLDTLTELSLLLGCDPVRARPSVFEAKDVEEVAAEEEAAAEQEFARQAGAALKQFSGQDFPTAKGTGNIKIHSVRGLAVDPNSEEFEVVAPLIVTYTGKSAPEDWAVAERIYEKLIGETIQSIAKDHLEEPTVKFLRRKKTDPFENDPRSLTLLRYRIQ